MSVGWTVVVGLVILVGIIGAIVQIWPSGPFIGGAILAWSIVWNTGAAWAVFAVAAVVLAAGFLAKYLIPGRRLARSGIPSSTLVWGLAGAAVGFFVIPVLGFLLGLILGIYLAEAARLGSTQAAWPATTEALRAVGLSIVIELVAALTATAAWVVGLFLV